jgi:NADH:ubiquinone oxidoreductase subunit
MWSGKPVGKDDQGNRYYIERKARKGYRLRRWVVYHGAKEASRVPPDWHRWLHYTTDESPADAPPQRQPWEQAHQQNLSGTTDAYRPAGHEYEEGDRASGTGDYEPWRPA